MDDADLQPLDRALLHSRQALIRQQTLSEPSCSPLSSPRSSFQSLDGQRRDCQDNSTAVGGSALGVAEATFNLANIIVGVGVLSVPYAFKRSGYFTLLIILVVIWVTATTGKWIGSAAKMAGGMKGAEAVPPSARDFAFLAHIAFGTWGRTFINAVTVLEVWLALVTFMVMNGDNAKIVSPVSPTLSVPISGATAALLCVVPDRYFAYLSMLSTLSLFVAAVAMVFATYMLSTWAEPYHHLGNVALIQVDNIPQSVGIIVFCFAGHPCFPSVYTSMRDPKKWDLSIDMSFLVAFVFYGCLGFVGYIVFGAGLDATVTENLQAIPGVAALACQHIAALCFLVKVQFTAPLMLKPVMVALWPPTLGAPEWPPGRILLLVVVTTLTVLVAVALQDAVAVLASLSGSLCVMTTSVLFPAVAHMVLTCSSRRARPRVLECLAYGSIIAFGAIMAVLGTVRAVQDLLAGRSSAT